MAEKSSVTPEIDESVLWREFGPTLVAGRDSIVTITVEHDNNGFHFMFSGDASDNGDIYTWADGNAKKWAARITLAHGKGVWDVKYDPVGTGAILIGPEPSTYGECLPDTAQDSDFGVQVRTPTSAIIHSSVQGSKISFYTVNMMARIYDNLATWVPVVLDPRIINFPR